jgi:hypothetical protein
VTKHRPYRAGKAPEVGPFTSLPVPAEHAAALDSMWTDRLHVVLVSSFALNGSRWYHLAIQRKDKAKITDHWRTLQRIKDLLLGTDLEAVELYPARAPDRFVDEGNDYHLWSPVGSRFPFGLLPAPKEPTP